MKYKVVLPMLTAIVIFAATTSAEAGIFGRLSVVWNGCNPCEPVACTPCEPIACNPCEAIVNDGCYDACAPGGRPFRPLAGLLSNMKARMAAGRCAPGCDPCEPVAAAPCEPIACDPCDPITVSCSPRAPFAGLFQNLRAKLATPRGCITDCDPCGPSVDPCAACR